MLHRIADWREGRQSGARKAAAAKVRANVPSCLLCDAGPAGYRFAEIASLPCSEENEARAKELLHHVENHEWEPLKEFREFRADQDDIVVYAVTGPHEGGTVVLVRDPFELYARVEISLEETITAEEVNRIRSLVSEDEWKDL